MKNKILALMLAALFALAVPLSVSADSQRYTPPAEKGNIYIVIKYKGSFARPLKTNVKINWGGYSRNEDVSPPILVLPNNIPEGFVIRLSHKKNDSLTLDVSTDGNIVSVFQGDAPSQSSQKGWKQINW